MPANSSAMHLLRVSILTAIVLGAVLAQTSAQQAQINTPYVSTPPRIVEAMLELAEVSNNDTVYDLGCGDGRIVIRAAQEYGARGVGIDINPARIDEARAQAGSAGVTEHVDFQVRDLFDADFRNATVVALYLLPDVNLRLRPRLLSELKPGTRVVSHSFAMGDWRPDKERVVDGVHIYLWTIPPSNH
jgi:SAM-dependent methyltransferase